MQHWQSETIDPDTKERSQSLLFYGKPSGFITQFQENAPTTYAYVNGTRLGAFESWETAKRRVEQELKL